VRLIGPRERAGINRERAVSRPSPMPRRMNPRIDLKKYAIEKDLAAYIHLKCGHYTTREEQEFYSVWRPQKGVYFCTGYKKCGKWVALMPKEKPQPLPDKPLF
jgi:hypothetical protein